MAMVTLYARFAEGSVTAVDGLPYLIRHGVVSVPQSCVPALEAVGFVQAPIAEQAELVPAVEDASDGGGGGAAAFTDLTDAPASITANAVMVGNAAGSDLAFAPTLLVDSESGSFSVNAANPDVEGNGAVLYVFGQPTGGIDNPLGQLAAVASWNGASSWNLAQGEFSLQAFVYGTGTAELILNNTTTFKMSGFDVVGAQTVDAAATNFPGSAPGDGADSKWIKVRIGSDDYAIQAIKITP